MQDEKIETPTDLLEDVSDDILGALTEVAQDVTERNTYMNIRDRVVYEDGLYDGLEFPDGTDKTMFNFLQRAVQIHKSQLMGRGFQVYTSYNKEDLSTNEAGSPQEQLAEAQNKKLKSFADARKLAIDAIIADNGGMGLFEQGAEIGSTYGGVVYKMYADKKNKKVKISLLETPQNYFPLWSDSDFRNRDADAYVHQISVDSANKLYGKFLKDQEQFAVSQDGNPFGNLQGNNDTSNPINQNVSATWGMRTRSGRKMVAVVEFTGIRKGWSNDGKKFVRCKPGDEKPFNALIVGGKVVQTIFDPIYIPNYYLIPNIIIPRRAWGGSDINDASISIMQTLIEVMSTWITLYHKEVAPLYAAKGFTSLSSIPRRKKKKATFVPMGMDQAVEPIANGQSYAQVSQQLISELKDDLVRVLGIGHVLFDDPTVNANSNQALMTTLKGVIDIVESKQKIYEPILMDMFEDALKLSTKLVPQLKDAVNDPGWKIYVRWPSVLRREDATYQQMWLNRFNAGTTSVDSYLEAMGVENTSEEIDRIRDDMTDPVRSAILGHSLPQYAGHTMNKSLGIPPWGYITPKVTLRGDLAPEEVGNMAHNYNWDQGPYGANIGPTGNSGMQANDAFMNANFMQQPADGKIDGPMPSYQAPNAQLTPDQNMGQTASQPGSGAPAVSPQGAINMANQQRGK